MKASLTIELGRCLMFYGKFLHGCGDDGTSEWQDLVMYISITNFICINLDLISNFSLAVRGL